MIYRCYSDLDEKIGLAFYPCKNLGAAITWEECHSAEPLIVFHTDYTSLLIDHFRIIYPTTDPTDGRLVEAFDECFDNWIGKEDWLKIMAQIKQKAHRFTELERAFYANVMEWLEKELEWADLILVEGNL